MISKEKRKIWQRSHKDWNYHAETVLGVNLDPDQKRVLSAIQHEPRVSVRSGNARGKDFVAAVAQVCHLSLNEPAEIINTGPTHKQVVKIMMAEVSNIYNNANINLGGRVLKEEIQFYDKKGKLLTKHFLFCLTANEYDPDAWKGFHSPHLMIVVTEASYLKDSIMDNIETMLQEGSKLVLIFNPTQMTGEAARSIKDPDYKKFQLNCLDAENVKAKEEIYPGQVQYEWIVKRIKDHCEEIQEEDYKKDVYDFKWEGKYYRPDNIFLVTVMGEFPRESEESLIRYSWVKAAQQRWQEWHDKGCPLGNGDGKKEDEIQRKVKLGVDVAGMGRDKTVLAPRLITDDVNAILYFKKYINQDPMTVTGKVIEEMDTNQYANNGNSNNIAAYVDTIGIGAGVHPRLIEQGRTSYGVNVAEAEIIKYLSDLTNQRRFLNLRAYLHWAVRDALDPSLIDKGGGNLMLPPSETLLQDLTEPRWDTNSAGKIFIEPKDDIKKRLKRSPDEGDAVTFTYYPLDSVGITFS